MVCSNDFYRLSAHGFRNALCFEDHTDETAVHRTQRRSQFPDFVSRLLVWQLARQVTCCNALTDRDQRANLDNRSLPNAQTIPEQQHDANEANRCNDSGTTPAEIRVS